MEVTLDHQVTNKIMMDVELIGLSSDGRCFGCLSVLHALQCCCSAARCSCQNVSAGGANPNETLGPCP